MRLGRVLEEGGDHQDGHRSDPLDSGGPVGQEPLHGGDPQPSGLLGLAGLGGGGQPEPRTAGNRLEVLGRRGSGKEERGEADRRHGEASHRRISTV